jgi:hypothetical protein
MFYHNYDILSSIRHEEEDFREIPVKDLIKSLENHLDILKNMTDDDQIRERFCHSETYETE